MVGFFKPPQEILQTFVPNKPRTLSRARQTCSVLDGNFCVQRSALGGEGSAVFRGALRVTRGFLPQKKNMYSDTQPPCLDVGGGYAFAVSVTGLWWPNGVPTAV